MLCYECGKSELVYETRDLEYSYRGKTTIIPSVKGEFCPNCGEAFLDDESADYFSAASLEFNKSINAETVDPKFIAYVRKKLGLNQNQAAELFGGGVNAFSRYETGRAMPPTSLVLLLKVLNVKPELLSILTGRSKQLGKKIAWQHTIDDSEQFPSGALVIAAPSTNIPPVHHGLALVWSAPARPHPEPLNFGITHITQGEQYDNALLIAN